MPQKAIKTQSNDPGSAGAVKPVLDPRFIIQIEGREFVKYPGLLDLGHQIGLESITVEPVQIPCKENGHLAVCKASVISKEGQGFSDIGDASPENCSARVSKHILRMASTRAIARALRTFTNIGMTCLEELDDADLHDSGNGKGIEAAKPAGKRQYTKRAGTGTQTTNPPNGKGNTSQPRTGSGNGGSPPMSDAQRRAIFSICKRKGMDEEGINATVNEMFHRDFKALSISEASSLIQHLQSAN